MDKKSFRKIAREVRDSIPEKERKAKSNLILEHLTSLPAYELAEHIFLYLSFRSEVDTFSLLRHALDQGKKIYAPITLVKEKALLCCRVKDPKKDMEIDAYGILSPKFHKESILPAKYIDLVIVPGLAFDEKKYRMGYGGGFYDRFIPKLSDHATTVALAFEKQIYPQIPIDPYDSRMDMIVTEKRCF